MRLSLLLPLLALPTSFSLSQHPLSVPSSFIPPPSSYAPISISSTIELSGSIQKSNTVYKLEKKKVVGGNGEWVVGIKGQEGWTEVREKGREVELKKLGRTEDGVTYYSLLPSSSSSTLTLSSHTTHASLPSPSSLPQTAEHLILLWSYDLSSLFSPLSQKERENLEEVKVKVKAPSPRLDVVETPEMWEKGYTKGGATVSFTASKEAIRGNSPQVAKVQFAQPEAMASIRSLKRSLEVSHWGGNLAVEDEVELVNSGATLMGHFSRLEHQKKAMQRRSSPLSVTSLSIVLPPLITSPYYYDIVGNVSTSRFRPSNPPITAGTVKLPSHKNAKIGGHSLLELTPRYPVLGGWNYSFTMGYDAPLREGGYLKNVEGRWSLKVPFLTAIKDVPTDEVRVEIRLPEGAKILKVSTPFPVDSINYPEPTSSGSIFGTTEGYTKTFLDSVGRPTIVLTKKNCSDRHGGDILVEYELTKFNEYLRKPLMISLVLGGFLALGTAVRRKEWGIGK